MKPETALSEEQQLSTATTSADVRAVIDKAQEILRLFHDAVELGYSIEFTLEQWKALVTICESGYLVKRYGGSQPVSNEGGE